MCLARKSAPRGKGLRPGALLGAACACRPSVDSDRDELAPHVAANLIGDALDVGLQGLQGLDVLRIRAPRVHLEPTLRQELLAHDLCESVEGRADLTVAGLAHRECTHPLVLVLSREDLDLRIGVDIPHEHVH